MNKREFFKRLIGYVIGLIGFGLRKGEAAAPLVLLSEKQALKFIFGDDIEIGKQTIKLTAQQKTEVEKRLGYKLFGVKWKKEFGESSSYAGAKRRRKGREKSEFNFYLGSKAGKIVGYACIDVVPGKWGPIVYIVGITPEGAVKDIAVMSMRESRGRPAKDRPFLKQFISRSFQKPMRLGKEIKGISRATITSWAMVDGVREVLCVFEIIYKQQ